LEQRHAGEKEEKFKAGRKEGGKVFSSFANGLWEWGEKRGDFAYPGRRAVPGEEGNGGLKNTTVLG